MGRHAEGRAARAEDSAAPERSRVDGVAFGIGAGALAISIWAGWIVWTDLSVANAASGAGFTSFDLALMRFAPPALLLTPYWLLPALRAPESAGRSPWLRLKAAVKPHSARLAYLLMMLGWGAPFVFFASLGLASGDPSLMAALVPGAAPVYAALLSAVLFGIWPQGRARLGVCVVAIAAIIGFWVAPSSGGLSAFWFTLAALGWAGYIVGFPRSGLAPTQAVGLVAAWSTAGLLVISPFAESRFMDAALSDIVIETLFQGVLAGALSIVAYTIALDRAPRLFAASLPAGVPVLVAIFAALFGEAAPTLAQTAGLALTTIGLAIIGTSTLRLRAAPED